jgi:hypothetical protein
MNKGERREGGKGTKEKRKKDEGLRYEEITHH